MTRTDATPMLLHLYGQSSPHAPVQIVGTRDGLQALRAAVDRALRRAEGLGVLTLGFETSDGEDYGIQVYVLSAAQMHDWPLPVAGCRTRERQR